MCSDAYRTDQAEITAPDRESAIDALGRALGIYAELGATRDARRVRSRLRELGVRRRVVTAEPEASGGAALTSAELAVARLVAEDMTNREVAERLFLSPHTVKWASSPRVHEARNQLTGRAGATRARLRDGVIVR